MDWPFNPELWQETGSMRVKLAQCQYVIKSKDREEQNNIDASSSWKINSLSFRGSPENAAAVAQPRPLSGFCRSCWVIVETRTNNVCAAVFRTLLWWIHQTDAVFLSSERPTMFNFSEKWKWFSLYDRFTTIHTTPTSFLSNTNLHK